MPTPAYQPLVSNNLTASTTGPNVPVNAQVDVNALADECSMIGMLGWAPTIAYTSGKITSIINLKGALGTKVVFTYLTSGPAIGKVADATHYWSNDTGATWTLRTDTGITAGKITYTYDGAGLLVSAAWS